MHMKYVYMLLAIGIITGMALPCEGSEVYSKRKNRAARRLAARLAPQAQPVNIEEFCGVQISAWRYS